MRYHIPFAQRPGAPYQMGPIYIGFDEPVSIQKRRGPFNWSGFTGLMMALISPLTLFLIAPIALLFSLNGLRKNKGSRGMAWVGTVLSLAATTVLSLVIFGAVSHNVHERNMAHQRLIAHQQRAQIAATSVTLKDATEELRSYRSEHQQYLPSAYEGNLMTVQHADAWKTELRYEPNSDGCIVRSAGPDREFNTGDDVTVKLDGKTDESALLEL